MNAFDVRSRKSNLFATPDSQDDLHELTRGGNATLAVMLATNFTLEQIAREMETEQYQRRKQDTAGRVRAERQELDRNTQALEDFINHDMKDVVECRYHQRLLQEQCITMKMLRNILNQRLALFLAEKSKADANQS